MQVLQQSLEQQATLLVLDNVSASTAAAAVPLLQQRHAGSRMLATAWGEPAIEQLRQAAIQQGWQPPRFHYLEIGSSTLSPATSMVLTEAEAKQLILQQMRASMQTASSKDQLDQLADCTGKAAAALRFSHAPCYVPKVLSVCACTLGLVGLTIDRLPQLLRQLRDAREPALHGHLDTQSQAYQDSAIFGQLTACFQQLELPAQQLWLAIVHAVTLALEFHDKQSLLLWLQCHTSPDTTMDKVQQQVSPGCLPDGAACSWLSDNVMQMLVLQTCGFAQICRHFSSYGGLTLSVHDLMAALGRCLAAKHGWCLPTAPHDLKHDTAHAVAITDCTQLLVSGSVHLPAAWSLYMVVPAPAASR